MLTTAQQATLKAYILSVPALAAQPNTNVGNSVIANALNAVAVPDFYYWRKDVTANETGNAWLGTDIDGMTSINMQRLQLLLASSPSGVFDMSRSDRRAGFENPFGTNVNNGSRVAMRAVWKKLALLVEKLFATGTGSSADPAVLTREGTITPDEIEQARSS